MGRQRSAAGRVQYHQDLHAAIGKCLPHRGLALQVEDGRVRWTPRILATCALLLGWSAGSNLQECFVSAREVVVAMYRSRRRPGESLAGFLQALSSQSAGLLSVVVGSLRGMTIRVSGRQWRWKEWVLMGADGSRVECPMTRGNEQRLGCAGKDKTTPQLFLTPLFQVASGCTCGRRTIATALRWSFAWWRSRRAASGCIC